MGQLPAGPLVGESEVFQPHRLIPAERDVHLHGIDLVPRVGDAGLLVHIFCAVEAGSRINLVPSGHAERLTPDRHAEDPRSRLRG
jgi:hypothetical protein